MTRGVKFIAAAGLFLVLGFISCFSLEARQFEPGKFVAIGDTFDLTGDLRTEIINNQEIRIIENETNKIVYSRIYNNEVILHNHSAISSGLSESVFAWYQEPYETIPHQALDGNFGLTKSKGKWKLKVIDNLNSDILGPDNQTIDDSGALNLWKIEIKGQPAGLELQLQPGWNFFSLPSKYDQVSFGRILY